MATTKTQTPKQTRFEIAIAKLDATIHAVHDNIVQSRAKHAEQFKTAINYAIDAGKASKLEAGEIRDSIVKLFDDSVAANLIEKSTARAYMTGLRFALDRGILCLHTIGIAHQLSHLVQSTPIEIRGPISEQSRFQTVAPIPPPLGAIWAPLVDSSRVDRLEPRYRLLGSLTGTVAGTQRTGAYLVVTGGLQEKVGAHPLRIVDTVLPQQRAGCHRIGTYPLVACASWTEALGVKIIGLRA